MELKTRPLTNRTWVRLRRLSQLLFFTLFLFLFLKSEYVNQETLPWPSDLFFRFDPGFGPLFLRLGLPPGHGPGRV
jgi:hypothetical protein